MSYILDALKKAEKERQRGVLPDMLTVQDIVAEKPAKNLHWVYLLAAALLLNAGALVWWLGFSQTDKSKTVQKSKTDNISHLSADVPVQALPDSVMTTAGPDKAAQDIRAAERTPAAAPLIEESRSSISVKNMDSPEQEIQPGHVLSDNIIRPSGPEPAKTEQSATPAKIVAGQTTVPAEVPDESRLYKLRELPSAIRQELPEFSVSALLFSTNPDSRMVRINDRMMHEGQDLTGGVKLEEIARDGIILKYRKYRFYVAVK